MNLLLDTISITNKLGNELTIIGFWKLFTMATFTLFTWWTLHPLGSWRLTMLRKFRVAVLIKKYQTYPHVFHIRYSLSTHESHVGLTENKVPLDVWSSCSPSKLIREGYEYLIPIHFRCYYFWSHIPCKQENFLAGR